MKKYLFGIALFGVGVVVGAGGYLAITRRQAQTKTVQNVANGKMDASDIFKILTQLTNTKCTSNAQCPTDHHCDMTTHACKKTTHDSDQPTNSLTNNKHLNAVARVHADECVTDDDCLNDINPNIICKNRKCVSDM